MCNVKSETWLLKVLLLLLLPSLFVVSQEISNVPIDSSSISPIAPPVVTMTTTTFSPTSSTSSPSIAPTRIPSFAATFSPTRSPSRDPTLPPSFIPTRKPTKAQTPSPTKTPTPEPTKAPSNVPVAPPTNVPVEPPTRAPVAPPTRVPVAPPTRVPVAPPTRVPVAIITQVPVAVVTQAPVAAVTLVPVAVVTQVPVALASPTPTAQDTLSPSIATVTPTISNSSMPSTLPTARSSEIPSSIPTTMPLPGQSESPSLVSSSPSLLPSGVGSGSPSQTQSPTLTKAPTLTKVPTLTKTPTHTMIPTEFGTDSPTMTSVPTTTAPTSTPSTVGPTRGPSINQSGLPSSFPSIPPTMPFQTRSVNISLVFDQLSQLVGSSVTNFAQVTSKYIATELIKVDGFASARATITVTQQTVVASNPALRRLTPLEVTFRTDLAFVSSITDPDIDTLVGTFFNSNDKRNQYVTKLKDTGDTSFSGISTFQAYINGVLIVDENVPNANDKGPVAAQNDVGISLYIIIGSAAGGVALCLMVGLIFFRRKRGAGGDPSNRTPYKNQKSSSPTNTAGLLTQEILVDNQDDISTLGDPMYGGAMMHIGNSLDKDETVTATMSIDYDYTKAYGAGIDNPSLVSSQSRTGGSMPGPSDLSSRGLSSSDMSGLGLGNMGTSLFSDDSSFEQQFSEMEDRIEVIAPAGKLGMVIDTPSGGVPVVHAIKDTSVLVNKVKVGDRLVSVDNEDTTGMTAMQVSKLISIKAENAGRALVFVRTRPRKNTEEP